MPFSLNLEKATNRPVPQESDLRMLNFAAANPPARTKSLEDLLSGKKPSDEEPPPPPEQQFKGYRQPPIEDRLVEARNFLADEDPNRCLGFREKLAEIDEYLAYIKDQKFSFDEKLYRDVKIMSDTHHDWDDRVQKGWVDTSCGTEPLIQLASNRLLTGSRVEELQRKREAMGVEEQMRDEYPPFSIERSGDYGGFIRALGVESNQDPEVLDDATNLLFVEGRAYDWAMREPAWIPYWMHPTKGLPTAPIIPEDEEPWYRKALSKNRGRTLGRPPKGTLPELLEKRQREINNLLAKGNGRTKKEEERLRILMIDHFPDSIKARWKAVQDHQEDVNICKANINQVIKSALKTGKKAQYLKEYKELLEDEEKDLRTKTQMYLECSKIWYNWIQKLDGVQCVVEGIDYNGREAYPETLGVLVFPDEKHADSKFTEMINGVKRIIAEAEGDPGYWDYGLGEEDLKALMRLLATSTSLGDDLEFNADKLQAWHRYEKMKAAGDPLNGQQDLHSERLTRELKLPIKDFWKKNINNVDMLPPWGEPSGLWGGTLSVPFQEDPQSLRRRNNKRNMREKEAREALEKEVSEEEVIQLAEEARTTVDYTPQAERRGIQRAAIELGLNLLCGNQEQHRPNDKFRIVQLPGPYVDWADIPEVPITIPLDPSHRPVELEPFYFTKKLARYRQRKDFEYSVARTKAIYQRRGLLDPPTNFKGPFTVATLEQFQETIKKAKDRYVEIYKRMTRANKEAPRPLMTRMLDVVDQGLRWNEGEPHPLVDEEKPLELTNEQIALLEEIAGPSWDTLEEEWKDAEVTAQNYDMAKLEEFRHDVDDILHKGKVPFWEIDNHKSPIPLFQDKSFKEKFKQQNHLPHKRSKEGIPFLVILKEINDKRIADKVPLWTEEQAKDFFEAMRMAQVIHYDDQVKGEEMISQIPFQGHPEDKYVISLESIKDSPGVELNTATKHYEVRYDADGTIGPPIVQPNKYEYLQQLSMKLGRLIKSMLTTLAGYEGNFDEELKEQRGGLEITENDFMKNLKSNELSLIYKDWYGICVDFTPSESLIDMALELHSIAPDLAERARLHFKENNPEKMTEQQAAILLQIQILEENNNNWESRFPENEHVWEFAAPRLIPVTQELKVGGEKIQVTVGPRKYFNMRRYPVGCQTETTQLAIKASGPAVAQKSDAKRAAKPQEPEQRPGEVYRGGNKPPFFPFGETPYQEAFQSWRMQQEMADIPEFQTKNGGKDQTPPRRFIPALPELPSNFVPKSMTPHEFRMREIQKLMTLPNAPDPNILENYYTQEEIMNTKRREAYIQRQKEVEEAHAAIAKEAGKQFKDMTRQEIQDICAKLDIDPFEMKLPEPGKKTSGSRLIKRQADIQPPTQTRSSKRIRREPVEDTVTEDDQTRESFTEGTGDSVTGEEETGDEVAGDETGEETGVDDSSDMNDG